MELYDNTKESVILSACIISKEARQIAVDQICLDDFYYENNRILCTEIFEQHKIFPVIDLITLKTSLETKGLLDNIGGLKYLIDINKSASSSANIQPFIDQLLKLSKLRKIQDLKPELMVSDPRLEPDEIISQLKDKIKDIDTKDAIKIITCNDMFKIPIEDIPLKPEDYIKTQIKSLDEVIYGFYKSEIITIAARPSQGKSTLALTIARNVANTIPVLFFSLEMPETFLRIRLLSSETNINSLRIQHNLGVLKDSFERQKLELAQQRLSKIKLKIVDKAGLKAEKIESVAHRENDKECLGMMIVDYLQIMSNKSKEQRYVRIGEDIRNLKNIGRELNIPVVVISQLGREVERRTNQVPLMADLRESGDIENDSDKIIFLYFENWETEKANNTVNGKLLIAKNKYGNTGNASIVFEKQYSKFI